jgi:hypothetical protein
MPTVETQEAAGVAMFRIALIAACALALTACASTHGPSCRGGEQSSVHDALYFGTAKAAGVVSQQEWAEFLQNAVTPRFPQGLTVWPATGQWRSANGAILQESSNVLTLVHSGDERSEKAVQEIVSMYKTQFQQEAVLRIRSLACASF